MKHKILFVDDEENILKCLKRSLIDLDEECLYRTDPVEALELCKQQAISVVVTDMRMPKMTGLELITRLKKISPATIPLVLSGYADKKLILQTMRIGSVGRYIRKPWKNEELVSSIKNSLKKFEDEKKNKILLFEREKQLNKQISQLLVQDNYMVRSTDKVKDFLSDVEKNIANIALLSFSKFERELFNELLTLKSQEKYQELKVILFTEENNNPVISRYLENGLITDIIYKPFNSDKFYKDLSNSLNKTGVIKKDRNSISVKPFQNEYVKVILRHPHSYKVVFGKLSNISFENVTFQPDVKSEKLDFFEGDKITDLNLNLVKGEIKTSGEILNIKNNTVTLKLPELNKTEKNLLSTFMQERMWPDKNILVDLGKK